MFSFLGFWNTSRSSGIESVLVRVLRDSFRVNYVVILGSLFFRAGSRMARVVFGVVFEVIDSVANDSSKGLTWVISFFVE